MRKTGQPEGFIIPQHLYIAGAGFIGLLCQQAGELGVFRPRHEQHALSGLHIHADLDHHFGVFL